MSEDRSDTPKSTLPDDPYDVRSVEHVEGWMRKILNEEIPDLPEAVATKVISRMSEVAGGWAGFCASVEAETMGRI